MDLVYADIELINGGDLEMMRRHLMDKYEVKRMWVNIAVDTSCVMLCINESIQKHLQLPVTDKRSVLGVDGNIIECDVVSSIELRFKNRATTCRAIVLPGVSQPVLGLIPFEDMDVLIHPQRQELIVNPDHPYFAQMKLK